MNPMERPPESPSFNERELILLEELDIFKEKDSAPLFRVVTKSDMSNALKQKVQESGFFTIEVTSQNHKDKEFLTTLDQVLYSAQLYAINRDLPNQIKIYGKKVMVIIPEDVLKACLESSNSFRHNWGLNISYGPTVNL